MLRKADVSLTVVGAMTNPESAELIREMEKAENIYYAGTVPHGKMNELYAGHDVFILPSLAEGSALSVFEALACGLPCIVTKNTGSVVEDGVNGYVIEVRSAAAIAEAVRKTLQRPELLAIQSENARKSAEYYSWDRYAEGVARILQEMEDVRLCGQEGV